MPTCLPTIPTGQIIPRLTKKSTCTKLSFSDSLSPADRFLAAFRASERTLVRQVFAESATVKCEVPTLLLDVILRAQFELFGEGRYRNLATWKRLIDVIRADQDGAADLAREVLAGKGGRN